MVPTCPPAIRHAGIAFGDMASLSSRHSICDCIGSLPVRHCCTFWGTCAASLLWAKFMPVTRRCSLSCIDNRDCVRGLAGLAAVTHEDVTSSHDGAARGPTIHLDHALLLVVELIPH